MGLFTDVNQNQNVTVEGSPVVITKTKKGAIIVCPECKGKGESLINGYGFESECPTCHGGGAIEVKVKK